VTFDEIKRCVWDCDGFKSPGPDGFNFKFYKLAWDLLQKTYLTLSLNFLE